MNAVPDFGTEGLLWLTIRRSGRTSSGERTPIPVEAWRELVRTDRSFRPVHEVQGVNPMTKRPMRIKVHDCAEWTDHPESLPYLFEFTRGQITISSADRHVVAKAREVAEALDAEVEVTVD